MQLTNPAPGRPVTSAYGWRIHPITNNRRFHHGTDFGGTFDVLAAGDGKIVHISYVRTGGGHVVIIEHQRDLFTVYYHGAHRTKFVLGDIVKAGDFLYRSGATGAVTGPHLHFEVRKSRKWGDTVAPEPYFGPQEPVKIKVDGVMGKQTWHAIQTILRDEKYYAGRVDGIPGKLTISGLQKYINDGKF